MEIYRVTVSRRPLSCQTVTAMKKSGKCHDLELQYDEV